MALKARKTVLLIKKEITYGVDAVPTGAADAVLASNVTLTPLDSKMVDRSYVRPYYGQMDQLPGVDNAAIDFEIELSGSGAAGTAPAYGKILKACGMSETVNAGVSVVYAPISVDGDALTIYFYLDGVLHKLLGSRGSMSLKLQKGERPSYQCKFQGLYVPVIDAALPTATLTSYIKPIVVSNSNTTAFSLHAYAGVLESFDFDLANEVTHRNLVGYDGVIITDRKPSGNVTIENTLIATKNWFDIARSATLGAFTVTHGTVAGNKVKIDMPSVQLTTPKHSESDGVSMLQMGMRPLPVNGNDEFTITVL